MAFLRKAFKLAVSEAETSEKNSQKVPDPSRRKFLHQSAQLGVGLGAGYLLSGFEMLPPKRYKIAIVGGGIAGLAAAHRLKKAKVDSFVIYEASNRIGGRMFTAKDIMGEGLTTELGGEFIDSTHTDMLQLVREFGLELLDTQAASETALKKDMFFFQGKIVSLEDMVKAFKDIAPKLKKDIDSLPDEITYKKAKGTAVTFDSQSISQYLTHIGVTGFLRAFIEVAYETEYGLSCQEQSAINLLFLISPELEGGDIAIFGTSDERYKIKGGNQSICDKLAERYQSHIETGKKLVALKKIGKQYELTFEQGAAVLVDFVLLTVPFSVLRNVDIQADLPYVKVKAIKELGYGNNAKLMMGFNKRIWREMGYTGSVFSDNGLQLGWDNAQLQSGSAGGITVYLGGNSGIQLANGTPQDQANLFLPKLNEFYPGVMDAYNQKVERFHWPTHPHTLGSYACYRVGQWQSIAGAEFEPVGGIFFAGEHCSADFQGYMNGGAETGRRAAELMLKKM